MMDAEPDIMDARYAPFATSDAGLVQIRSSSDTVSGMGFLISPWYAVTCAHVINAALGRDVRDKSIPPEDVTVTVTAPLAEDVSDGEGGTGMPRTTASLVRFRPPGRLPSDDIALLRLSRAAPQEVGMTLLAAIPAPSLANNELDVFGAPSGTTLPIHFPARFAGKTNQAWVQIDDVTNRGMFVTGGFSGGRVWSHNHEAAVGMVVAKHISPDQRVAFMIPAASILDFLQGIPGEIRRVSPGFCRAWTFTASISFLLILTHFLGDRMTNYPTGLALGAGNPVMNAFQGLRISSILVPLMLFMLVSFSRSFSEHPRWQRVPLFGNMREPAKPARSKFTAILSLVLFALLPAAAQVHFFEGFVTKGHVYIDPPVFGMTAEALGREQQICDGYCTHVDAGRMQLVTPINNAPGGYFDNAYHYGDLAAGNPKSNSVTFFPILEPVVYGILLGTSLGLLAYLLRCIISTPIRLRAPAATN
ncbi:trypsin-like peptidase domain-containing protein [Rhizobium leguminosarum]|uniref:trypsin-like peptidase domain-containing protein n=1 Tax=Rhizobium leguminosarum TaxID=384 RepID=UPI0013DCC2C2|nr:trypsin-like peptidase domain-containing protein [Rhizobium leguminosarum]NEK35626.1 hypothetical protein [Rhizobium leguminosarum]